jgi:hypothetical protein
MTVRNARIARFEPPHRLGALPAFAKVFDGLWRRLGKPLDLRSVRQENLDDIHRTILIRMTGGGAFFYE